jgi:multidrug resistance efflux pump
MARTAVIAGTAQATANAVNRRQASRNMAAYQQAEQQTYAQPQQQYAPPPQAAGGSMDDKIAQLERLSQLRAQGVLTEQEFAQQKAAILG